VRFKRLMRPKPPSAAGGSVRAMHGMLGKPFSQILTCGECSYVQAFFPPQHAKVACRGPRVWRNARVECHSFAYTICENAVSASAALVFSSAAHRVEGRPRPGQRRAPRRCGGIHGRVVEEEANPLSTLPRREPLIPIPDQERKPASGGPRGLEGGSARDRRPREAP